MFKSFFQELQNFGVLFCRYYRSSNVPKRNMAAPTVHDINTMFKDSFKYYKSRKSPPDLRGVIDFETPDLTNVRRLARTAQGFELDERLGLKSPETWEIFEISHIPGLIFIKNPFTANGQRYWITKCLRDYSRKPNKLNLDAHNLLGERENWWDVCTDDTARGKELASKLRWATLGYHHNWDTKRYSEDSRAHIPAELSNLTETIAKALGFDKFKAEAAIINYYRMDSTLAGHTDHSEIDRRAPLFSISFGQSAIFLVGGSTQEEPAKAMFLRSGDVLVMAGESRLRYHGVPRILPVEYSPWESSDAESESNDFRGWEKARKFVSQTRININVRQVLKHGQTSLSDETNKNIAC